MDEFQVGLYPPQNINDPTYAEKDDAIKAAYRLYQEQLDKLDDYPVIGIWFTDGSLFGVIVEDELFT